MVTPRDEFPAAFAVLTVLLAAFCWAVVRRSPNARRRRRRSYVALWVVAAWAAGGVCGFVIGVDAPHGIAGFAAIAGSVIGLVHGAVPPGRT